MKYKEQIENLMNKYNYVGVATMIVDNNNIYTSCNGYSDLDKKTTITEDSIFRIASISKVIIALGIMKLYEEHKVDIKEDISVYLGYKVRNPHFPDAKITLEMLMTQTSSISDGADNVKGYDGVNGPKMEIKLRDLLTNPKFEYYLDKTFNNVLPGSTFEYSNFGCGILACIIEKVSGVYFSDYIRDKILLPLDIDGSYRISDIVHRDRVVTLYDYDEKENKFILSRNLDMFLKYEFPRYSLGDNFRMPAGGLFISLNDLSKIMKMMMDYGVYKNVRIFQPSTIEFMKEVHWHGTSDDPQYKKKGLQLLILEGYGEPLYGHFGNAYGLRSYMLFGQTRGYIFLCNGANFGYIKEKGITDIQEDVLNFMTKYQGDKND